MTAYKQTELGLIPSDWEVVKFGEITELKNERVNPLYQSGQFCIELEHLNSSTGLLCGHTFTKPTSSLKSIFKNGDILFGKLRAYLRKYWLANRNGVCSTEIWVLNSKNNLSVNPFLFYIVQSNSFIKTASEAYGTHMPRSDWNVVQGYFVPLPPKPEQTAIATALSDTDALLAELEKLLAKKHAIKTATMQQLLTGKTRLPEFAHRADGTPKGSLKTEWGDVPEDWEVVALGDVGYFQAGVGFPLTIQGKKSGKYPFFKVSDLNNIGNETYLQASNNYINEQDKELISAKTIPINSIVFAKIGAAVFLERKRINNQESLIDNNMMAYIPNHKFLYKFAYYCFLRMKLSLLVEVTALPSLSSTELGKTKIFIPKSTTEQTAIAQILGDMDSEITALQARIEKLREIKQGMMQNLLTGKIRLPF